MGADQSQRLRGHFSNQLFELFVFLLPCFYLFDQIHRHIDGFGLSFLLVGQLPAGDGTAFAFNRAQRPLNEGADLSDPAQGALAEHFVTIYGLLLLFHITKLTYLLI